MEERGSLALRISEEVSEALQSGRPVVAMESCVFAQGLPRPLNYDAALQIMEVIREEGAVPAIVAFDEGQGIIGVSEIELKQICRGKGYIKANCGDIPGVVALKQRAATTVSASIILAEKAGIKVFTTGGLGGVSPHWLSHFDASSDISQLARTHMAVVCSGIKSVLDVTTTVEVLETLGIPVALYRTESFPRFYTSGIHVGIGSRVDTLEQLAVFYNTSRDLLGRGIIVANPAPLDKQLPSDVLQKVLNEAMERAEHEGHLGKQLTPFLLDYMARETQGATLEANRALLVNNARLAAQLAVRLV